MRNPVLNWAQVRNPVCNVVHRATRAPCVFRRRSGLSQSDRLTSGRLRSTPVGSQSGRLAAFASARALAWGESGGGVRLRGASTGCTPTWVDSGLPRRLPTAEDAPSVYPPPS